MSLPENPEKEGRKGRFPSWLHRRLPKGCAPTRTIVDGERLHTVCEEAKCPNRLECWSKKTATFLIMGNECTRSCGFCDIRFSKTPKPLDLQEPQRVAKSVKALGLRHVVITMVARDDLPDGGAAHLIQVIEEVRKQNSQVTVEVLTSDFDGNFDALHTVLQIHPEVFNHNIETVRELSPQVRYRASYDRSLEVLKYASSHSDNPVKSGLMVGFGETQKQVWKAIQDLYSVGCEIITIGQYLQPSSKKIRVKEFVTPQQFKEYEEYGRAIGVSKMICGPFVRSSYNAEKHYSNHKIGCK